jgi:uncharacterized membrane protein
MSSKWTSRKFWVAIVGQVVGIVTLVWGASTAGQVEAIAGAVIIIATALGYLKAEKDVDVAREGEKQ